MELRLVWYENPETGPCAQTARRVRSTRMYVGELEIVENRNETDVQITGARGVVCRSRIFITLFLFPLSCFLFLFLLLSFFFFPITMRAGM